MKVELRNDSVLITGYVNAVERYSKPIREVLHGSLRTFIERIRAGTFRKALQRNDNVLVLLNHDADRVLAGTADGTAVLEEDNIGLRAEITIKDAEVVRKAREGKLVGWSFGFNANSDELGTEGRQETRTVTDLDLVEVSILDNTKSPAYYGTSISARSDNMENIEIRSEAFDSENEAEGAEEATLDTVLEALNAISEVVNSIAQKVSELSEQSNETDTDAETQTDDNIETDAVDDETSEDEASDAESETSETDESEEGETDDAEDEKENRSLDDYESRLSALTKA